MGKRQRAKPPEAKARAVEEMRAWRKEMKEARRNKQMQIRVERSAAARAKAETVATDGVGKICSSGATHAPDDPDVPTAKESKKRTHVAVLSAKNRQHKRKCFEDDPEVFKVVVAGIPFHISEDRLKEDFAECGEVVTCRLLRDRQSGKSRGIAFVSFSTQDGLDAALAYHGEDYGGRALTVEVAKKGEGKGAGGSDERVDESGPGEKPEGCTSVIVKGLAYSVTEEDLKNTFKTCGSGPQHVNMLRDKTTGAFRGIAFVDFDDEDAVDDAVKLHGSVLNGRRFFMDYAAPRAKSTGPGKKPRGCTSVVVKGLAFNVTESMLKKTFKSCGDGPTVIRFKIDKQTGEPTGIAFLEFADSEALDAAVSLGGTKLNGRRFKVEYAMESCSSAGSSEGKRQKQKPQGCTSIVVQGLAGSVTEAALMHKFRSCGKGPRNANLVLDKDSGKSVGMAFVNFSDEVAVDDAMKFHGAHWKGQTISVGYVKPKRRRSTS